MSKQGTSYFHIFWWGWWQWQWESQCQKFWLQFDFNHWMMNTATTKFISARAGKQCGEVYLISCAACSSTGISFSSIWLQPCCLQLWYEFCIWSLFDLSLFCHCLLQLCGVFQLVTMNQGKSWKINFLNLRRSKERKKDWKWCLIIPWILPAEYYKQKTPTRAIRVPFG